VCPSSLATKRSVDGSSLVYARSGSAEPHVRTTEPSGIRARVPPVKVGSPFPMPSGIHDWTSCIGLRITVAIHIP